jgi:hypothetical protein
MISDVKLHSFSVREITQQNRAEILHRCVIIHIEKAGDAIGAD